MDIKQLSPFSPAQLADNGPKATWASAELDGQCVHGLRLKLGGTAFTKAMISSIEVNVAGKPLLPSISGTNLQSMNTHKGLPNNAAYLDIPFGNPEASDYYGKHAGDLDLSVVKKGGEKAVVEVIVKYTGATAPTLLMEALITETKADNSGVFKKGEGALVKVWQHTTISPGQAVANAAQNGINMGENQSGSLLGEYFFHNGIMTSLRLLKDGDTLLDDISQADLDYHNSTYGRVAVANLYAYVPIVEKAIGRFEPLIKGPKTRRGAINSQPSALAVWEHRITTNAGGNIELYVENIIPVNKL